MQSRPLSVPPQTLPKYYFRGTSQMLEFADWLISSEPPQVAAIVIVEPRFEFLVRQGSLG